ncbi:hypothetical protein CYLTODRAFT_422365 [Cylindrobasidium torrendii FP15055 ss-10]|uniref:F-box domain-containing protein n=1 Tax=Cylindrobasidium torrendii FP15055 ss-10 TaxID=1314674 RepID=A0A0D7BBM5_9AGAR|nr:hypothetical protein CYLTODRAFT_422365 [Cylindrobasidium torrendii FP15055 ss-10]
MASLTSLPTDVLELIAVLCASSLQSLLHLMLAGRTFYLRLSIAANPHIYATICRRLFNVPFISQGVPQSSAVADELFRRLRVLRRIRDSDLTTHSLTQDLWTAFGLVLEGGAAHLREAGFLQYATTLLRRSLLLPGDVLFLDKSCGNGSQERVSLLLWLVALTIKRDDILGMDEERHEKLTDILMPLLLNKGLDLVDARRCYPHVCETNDTAASPSSCAFSEGRPNSKHASLAVREDHSLFDAVVFYGQAQCPRPRLPPALCAAGTLYFALRQAHTLQEPPGMPLDRAAANISQRSGPTQADFHSWRAFRTPLFADYIARPNPLPGADPCLNVLSITPSAPPQPSVQTYILMNLPGVWDGSYFIAPFATPNQATAADFICQRPMQCKLDVRPALTSLDDDPFEWSLRDIQQPHRSRELEVGHTSLLQFPIGADDFSGCIVTGQTLEDHDEAWGAYLFYGKVYRDGRIVLKREVKGGYNDLSTIVFEGHLFYGASLVGSWRSRTDESCPTRRGIFSMRRTPSGEETERPSLY